MRMQDTFDVIYTHTEGEPLCIVHSGIPYPAGSSILAKRAFLEQNYDWLRKALMQEPRGHKDMFGVFLTPPSSSEFDAGLIYMDGSVYSHMCGHGTIAVSMAMVALGLVPRGQGAAWAAEGRTAVDGDIPINPSGGLLAKGHPVGATGAIITTKALYELARTGGKTALVTLCIGGGQGIALAIERV